MHEFVQVYSSSLLQIFTFYCYLSRAHRRRAAFLLSRVLAFRSSLSLSLLSFSRPLFSILVIYLLIYFSTRSNTTKGWPFLSFSPFEAPSPPLCLFIKFVLLLLSEGNTCIKKRDVLGAQIFLFFLKPLSLIFAILLFVASPVVPPTLSSPPFSSSSVCIPGCVVDKESTST